VVLAPAALIVAFLAGDEDAYSYSVNFASDADKSECRFRLVRCRRDESDTGKVAPVAAWIACQQRQLRHSCMGADKKIGQHSGPATTMGVITLKHLAGEKQRGARNLYELKPTRGKHTINVLDTRRADRELRTHDG